jgi:glycosyltransferase involved in cell wall biosynthesis
MSQKFPASGQIRIGHIIDNLRREGAQKELVHLVEGLASHGYIQRVYCLNNTHPDIVAHLQHCGAQVIVFGRVQVLSLLAVVRLARDISCWQPHIIHTRLFFSDVLGRTLAHVAGVPVIVSSIENRNIHSRPWQRLLYRLTVQWAQRITFNSKHVIPFSQAFEGVQPEQARYIPNGVRLELPDPQQARQQLCTELRLSTDTRFIGMVARLMPQKGHRYLLDAFARIADDMQGVVLLLIGEGILQQELAAQAERLNIAHRVLFLGLRNDIPNLLAALELYVHSSLFEGMPNAVMEAMAAGKPIVATGVDGVQELIIDGESGWLVEPGNAAALAERLRSALQHPDEAQQRGAAAAERARRHFSLDVMVQSFDHLYREIGQHVAG